ncbi:MAG: DUF2029 domain-containing protein, partial [Thermomicrobiaceae bacterium]|nr:DUF2029 domain-containing protein [Thermomicrobiaceae bacterium]
GPPTQRAFNDVILREVGAYSDIASLYFRDQLWRRPVPYVDYPLEYPVGIGALSWLVSLATSGVTAYFLATAAVMAAAGLGTVALLRWAPGSNPWLLALWPGLPLYVALNWDLLALLPTVAALLLLRRGRVGWSAALLAAATWIKFFPIVLAPLALLALLLERRWRAALGFVALFGVASVAINAPFALRLSPGVGLRDGWLYFFRFNQDRPPDPWLSNLWDVLTGLGLRLTVAEINRATTLLLALGLAALGGLLCWSAARRAHAPRAALLPAAVAAIGWLLLVNKVYSPQYSLWLAALLALTAAPLPLAVAFAAADLAAFAGSFTLLYLLAAGSTATSDWFYAEVEW